MPPSTILLNAASQISASFKNVLKFFLLLKHFEGINFSVCNYTEIINITITICSLFRRRKFFLVKINLVRLRFFSPLSSFLIKSLITCMALAKRIAKRLIVQQVSKASHFIEFAARLVSGLGLKFFGLLQTWTFSNSSLITVALLLCQSSMRWWNGSFRFFSSAFATACWDMKWAPSTHWKATRWKLPLDAPSYLWKRRNFLHAAFNVTAMTASGFVV